MPLYSGIDLHANNSYLAIIDEADELVEAKRLPNDIELVRRTLEPYRDELVGIAVESTFNWYWLVDGLEDCSYTGHLVNTLAAQQYQGLKYTDDKTDARWLAHLLRLGILPTGWICPKNQRAVRDLLRRRSQLVRQRTASRLGLRNVLERTTARRLSANALKRISPNDLADWIEDPNVRLSMSASLAVIDALTTQIDTIEARMIDSDSRPPTSEVLGFEPCAVSGAASSLSRSSGGARCCDPEVPGPGREPGTTSLTLPCRGHSFGTNGFLGSSRRPGHRDREDSIA